MLGPDVVLVTYRTLRTDAGGRTDGDAAKFNLDAGSREAGRCVSTRGRGRARAMFAPESRNKSRFFAHHPQTEKRLGPRSLRMTPGSDSSMVCKTSVLGNWRRRAEAAQLHFVATEDVILFAAGAVGALEAADEEHSHSQGDQDGQHTCVRRIQCNRLCICHGGLRSPSNSRLECNTS